MKKIFVWFCFLFFAFPGSNLFCQKVGWGINILGNSAYHVITNPIEKQISHNRKGISGGIFLDIDLSRNLKINPEINYINKGAEIETRQSNLVSDVSARLSYLSVPLNLKLGVRIDKSLLYILAGPRIDVLIGDNENGLNGIYQNRENINFGGSFGLGIYCRNSNRGFYGAEIRYSPDVTTYKVDGFIYNNTSTVYSSGTNFRNESLELFLYFGIKKF